MSNQTNISENKVINFGAGPGKLPEEVTLKLLHILIEPIIFNLVILPFVHFLK